MKNSFVIGVIAVIVVAGGGVSYALVQNQNHQKSIETSALSKKAEAAAMMKKQEETVAMTKNHQGDAIQKTDDTGAAMSKGIYTDYDQAKLANAQTGKVVLDFSATWCPICQESDKNFKAANAPDGLTLLKVDYDKSTDLKKKYGVTYQHTFVQVDKDGNLIKKWTGTSTYDQLQEQVI